MCGNISPVAVKMAVCKASSEPGGVILVFVCGSISPVAVKMAVCQASPEPGDVSVALCVEIYHL